jgi:DNA-binding MarR family transcriptional regulator
MPRKNASPGPRYEALLRLLQTAETIWSASRVFFSQWKISPSQFNILNILDREPNGLSQTELSRRLIMHRSNVTGLVDRLEARRLVKRLESPADRRVYRVVATQEGRKLIKKILPHYHRAAENVWGNFPVSRAAQLARELDRLSANAAAMAGDAIESSD